MYGMGFMWFGWLWVIIFILIILAGIYFFASGFRQENTRPASTSSTSSLEILKQRYAKGEITEEEFRKMKKEIE
jgi:putative membrane protein